MEDMSWLVSFWGDIVGWSPVVKYSIGGVVTVAGFVVRNRKHRSNMQAEIAKARREQRAEDKADEREKLALSRRIDASLNMLYSRLYTSMQDFVYNHPEGGYRYIKLVQHKHKRERPANEYLSDYQTAMKAVIFKVMKPYFIEQMLMHDVATTTQSTATNDSICKEARSTMLTEVHKRCGNNSDTKAVEDSVVTFEQMLDTYMEICTASDLLRHKRNEEVAKAIEAVK